MRAELFLDLLIDRVVDLAALRRADRLGRGSADCDLPGHLQMLIIAGEVEVNANSTPSVLRITSGVTNSHRMRLSD